MSRSVGISPDLDFTVQLLEGDGENCLGILFAQPAVAIDALAQPAAGELLDDARDLPAMHIEVILEIIP